MSSESAKQKMENWREKIEKALYEKNAITDVLAMLEEKTGVKRTYYVAGRVLN